MIHRKCLLLLFFSLPYFVWSTGQKEQYGMIIDNRENYFYRALEHNLILQAVKSNYDIEVKDMKNGLNASTIISNYLDKNNPVIILSPTNAQIIEESNKLIIEKDNLVHILKNGDLIVNNFIGGLVLFQAIPIQFTVPTVPWGFVGMDAEAIANTYLQEITTLRNRTASSTGKIVVLSSANMSLLRKQIYQALLSMNNTNNTIQLYKISLEESVRQNSYTYVSGTFMHNNSIVAIITFNDEIAIGAGQAYDDNNTSSVHRPIIIGFGGSQESIQAIEQGSITMTLAPDYKQYAKYLLDAADKIYKESTHLIEYNINYETPSAPQKPLLKTMIPFSVIKTKEQKTTALH